MICNPCNVLLHIKKKLRVSLIDNDDIRKEEEEENIAFIRVKYLIEVSKLNCFYTITVKAMETIFDLSNLTFELINDDNHTLKRIDVSVKNAKSPSLVDNRTPDIFCESQLVLFYGLVRNSRELNTLINSTTSFSLDLQLRRFVSYYNELSVTEFIEKYQSRRWTVTQDFSVGFIYLTEPIIGQLKLQQEFNR